MVLIVPFDGSNLSKAALVRAVQFDSVLKEGVFVVSVIPENNAEYAREKGWIDATAPFDADTVVSHLRSEVAGIAPEAVFHYFIVDRYAPRGTIAGRIREFARTRDASIVFIGSENAGRIVRAITVGGSIAADNAYDMMIVSHENLSMIRNFEEKRVN